VYTDRRADGKRQREKEAENREAEKHKDRGSENAQLPQRTRALYSTNTCGRPFFASGHTLERDGDADA